MLNAEKQTNATNGIRYKKGKNKRTEILEAAKSVLMEEGYSAFTTRSIADRLGMNRGHFYYYFPTKISLVRALIELFDTEYAQCYDSIFHSSDEDPEVQFNNFIDFLLDDVYNPQMLNFTVHLWALLEQESSENNNLINEVYETERARLNELLQPLSRQIQPAELTERIALMLAMTEGLTLMVSENPSDLPGIRKKVLSLARRLIMDPDLFKQDAT